MRISWTGVVTLAFALGSAAIAEDENRLQMGVGYASSYGEGRVKALRAARDTGAQWLTLSRPYFQHTPGETEVPHGAPSDDDLTTVAAWAHEQGLQVTLALTVPAPEEGKGVEQIGQGFGEKEWAEWFAAYQAFVSEQAVLARRLGVDQLCVGRGLGSTTHREIEWRELIRATRREYSGALIYAAGSEEALHIGWWDAVDAIGVDATWDLTGTTIEELVHACRPHVARLKTLARRWDREIILTEIGGAGSGPDYDEAVLRALFYEPWIGGVYKTQTELPTERELLSEWYGGKRVAYSGWIYKDQVDGGWQASSWRASINLQARGGRAGSPAIQAGLKPTGGLTFEHPALQPAGHTALVLYLDADPRLEVQLVFETDTDELTVDLSGSNRGPRRRTGDRWRRVAIPLPPLHEFAGGPVRIHIQDLSGTGAKLRLDELRLVSDPR